MHTKQYFFLIFSITTLNITLTSLSMDTMEQQYQALIAKEDAFKQKLTNKDFPQPINSIRGYFNAKIGNKSEEEQTLFKRQIIAFAQNIQIICHNDALKKAAHFLEEKRKSTLTIEQNVYADMTLPQFIFRLYNNRPLTCYQSLDDTLRLGEAFQDGQAYSKHKKIGTSNEEAPFVLKDYLSYSEREISELFGLANDTLFINKGDRNNRGIPSTKNDYEEKGILLGLVGARYEQAEQMACKTLIDQGNKQNGDIELTKHNLRYPTKPHTTESSILIGKYFRPSIHKERLRLSIEPFLHFANRQGEKVYLDAIGLGLGNWTLFKEGSDENETEIKAMLEVFKELLENNTFENIDTIDFSWITGPNKAYAEKLFKDINNQQLQITNNAHIKIKFSLRNPADKLTGDDEGKLLIAMYPWDGNSFPGNEYWIHILAASGDPAAACCSLIASLQNPLINGDNIQKNIKNVVDKFIEQNPNFKSLMVIPAKPQSMISKFTNISLPNQIIIALLTAGFFGSIYYYLTHQK